MSEPMTFKQIGEELGVSEQRAKQIYTSALNKLRRSFPATLQFMLEMSQDKQNMRNG